jgi:hypothetical protein
MDEDIKNILKNQSFCAMPFVSMMLNTDSFIRFCCIASGPNVTLRTQDNQKYTVGKHSIEEAWNSENLKEIRRAMIRGEPIESCKNCYHQESINKDSYRMMMTREWIEKIGKDRFFELIKKSVETDFSEKLPLVYLDLRLGNLCNLKCRMCSPFNSSQIAKEHFDLWNDGEYQRVWSDQFGKNPEHLKNEQIWFDSNFLWDEVIKMIPSLRKVYMTGGEPTLIENNYRFMQECIHAGANDQIELFFNINCTNVTDRFLDLVSKFKTVKINASLDGFSKVNDYIRFPSNWEKVKTNFERLAAIENITLNITPVIQTYNVLDCINMLYFVDEISERFSKDVGLDFLINRHPHYLDVTILPEEIRYRSAENLKKYKMSSIRYRSNWMIKNSVDSIINLLESPRNDNHGKLIKDFYIMTKALDKKRNQSFEETFPEIYDAIRSEIQ